MRSINEGADVMSEDRPDMKIAFRLDMPSSAALPVLDHVKEEVRRVRERNALNDGSTSRLTRRRRRVCHHISVSTFSMHPSP